jgi:DNA-binding winged helix-turn-helix (wHTH) protein
MNTTGSVIPFTPMLERSFLRANRSALLESPSAPEEFPRSGSPTNFADDSFIAFGTFAVYPSRRILLDNGRPTPLGGRALDLLLALLERPGELVAKQELMSRVWPGLVVEEGNLKANVALLRRALRDGQHGARYICTVSGRGYCFVGTVSRGGESPNNGRERLRGRPAPPQIPTAAVPDSGFAKMLAAQVSTQRFTTVVGAGDLMRGMLLAAATMADYKHGVHYIDLAAVDDPRQLPAVIAKTIVGVRAFADPLAAAASFLRDKHALLILDNCRSLVAEVSAFADAVLEAGPSVHILATSR